MDKPRVAPAIGLFFLAPLVAEFLLGDLPITFLAALVVLAPMYGGGALLIREVVRRTGRGWPSLLVLALAYGIVEEAFTTQTLFNPNYLHMSLGLLRPAYIAALGIGAWWTVFVLTLHTVWSVSVSVALTEALVPDSETSPWLGSIGLTVTAVLFLLGAVASTRMEIKQDHFVASMGQFAGAAIACVLLVLTAFRLPRTAREKAHAPGRAPSPWLVGGLALAEGSIFLLVPKAWAWRAVGIYLVLDVTIIVAVSIWSAREGWGKVHRLALAGGAALAYAWHAFIQMPVVGQNMLAVDRAGNAVFAASLIVLLWIAARRTRRTPAPEISAA
ncbi:MAG TPA: hypothetical protein VMG31_06735 [Verrucomicrobiae bacterium]|nr:hypothetical protein [Verrucomicrobiae bacterium]